MDIDIKDNDAAQVVCLSGEVDLQTSPRLRDALLGCIGGGKAVVVDLGAVEYIDSSGVASLVEAFQAARAKSLAFSLANVSDTALRVLKLARLDQVFQIHDTVDTALAAS